MCEGTRRYDKSEQIRIISHARSDQTYADTYRIWTLVHSRYRSQQIHIPDSYRFRTYKKTNRFIDLYLSHIQSYTCSEVPVGTTGLILILQNLYLFCRYESTRGYYRTYTYFTNTGVPVGITELILILLIRKYP